MFRTSNNFDKLLDKATSELQVEPDWAAVLEVCDAIRGGDTQPKYAVTALRKKLYSQNPHVAFFALQVLESCVKNCGAPFHSELLTRTHLDELREMCKLTPNEKMKAKILELIQVWAHAFRNDPSHKVVQDTLTTMRGEGFTFPVLKESDAMFAADQAPQWVEGDTCHRCKGGFSLVQRKHHCRCCGQIFCDKCSSKSSTIPKFGIEKEVRVCEDCFGRLNKTLVGKPVVEGAAPLVSPTHKKSSRSSKNATATTPSGATAPSGKTDQELQEEEELQLALALSQSEAETSQRRNTSKPRASSIPESKSSRTSNERPRSGEVPMPDDPELTKYMDREYWEQINRQRGGEAKDSVERRRSSSPAPSAPQQSVKAAPAPVEVKTEDTSDLDRFLVTLKKSLNMFSNRMNSNKDRCRPIANDSSVQSLFLSITNEHSELIKHMQDEDDRRLYYEGLQDKLTEIKDARAALDALREEHQERKRREAEEAENIRQRQMTLKLELMRKKKQEYLDYQKQVALARIQEQERLMQLRQEQNKYNHHPPPRPPSYQQQQQQHPIGQYMPPQPAPEYQPPVSMATNGHVSYPHPQQPQGQYHIPNGNAQYGPPPPQPVAYPIPPSGYPGQHPPNMGGQNQQFQQQTPNQEPQKAEEPLISFD